MQDAQWHHAPDVITEYSMPHNFLAIDLGAESGRAILGDTR